MPSGKTKHNSSELLGSEMFSFLLSQVKKKYDFIIIDTSPVAPTSDALLLAPQTDGVLMVVKSGAVHRKIITNIIEKLKASKANVLGVVLNEVNLKRDKYYKYYSSYYGE